MSNAARRVLELFLQTPKQGVTGVTGVTRPFVTPKNPMVTPVTPVTYQKQHSPGEGVTGVTAAPPSGVETIASEARIIEWLNRNPTPSPAGRCAWCGSLKPEAPVSCPSGPSQEPMHGFTGNAGDHGRRSPRRGGEGP